MVVCHSFVLTWKTIAALRINHTLQNPKGSLKRTGQIVSVTLCFSNENSCRFTDHLTLTFFFTTFGSFCVKFIQKLIRKFDGLLQRELFYHQSLNKQFLLALAHIVAGHSRMNVWRYNSNKYTKEIRRPEN